MLLSEGKNSARIMEEKGNHIRFTILSSLSSFLFHKICFYSDISLNGYLIRNLLVVNFLHDYSIFESRFDHFARISQLVVQTNQLSRMYRFHFRGLGININLRDIFPFIQAILLPLLHTILGTRISECKSIEVHTQYCSRQVLTIRVCCLCWENIKLTFRVKTYLQQ